MEFSPDINERIDTLSKKCYEKKKVILDFIGLMQARAELEEYYSRNIERIAESLTRLIHGKDSLKDLFILLKSYFHMQTEQTRTLARQIKNDVIQELEEYIQKDIGWQKQVNILQKKHQKEIKRNIDTLNQFRDEYLQALLEEKRFQQNNSIQKKLNYRQCEIKLQNFISYYNQYIETYFQDIAQVQHIFETTEINRRTKIQDAAIKYVMFEVSVVRNLQYDLNGISNKVEQYNPKNDLEKLFKDPQSDKPLLSKLNFENYKQFLQQQIQFKPEILQSQKKKKPIFEQQGNKVDIVQQTSNQIYMKLFQSAIFNNIITDETVNKLEDMLEQTSASIYVDSLDRVLRLKINQDENEDNDQIGFQMSPEAYVQLMKLMITLFNFCDKKNQDGLTVLRALNLSKYIYKIINPPENNQEKVKLSLYDGLNHHPILGNHQLWLNYAQYFQNTLNVDNSVFTDNNLIKDQLQQQIEDFLLQLEKAGCKRDVVFAVRFFLTGSQVQEVQLI